MLGVDRAVMEVARQTATRTVCLVLVELLIVFPCPNNDEPYVTLRS